MRTDSQNPIVSPLQPIHWALGGLTWSDNLQPQMFVQSIRFGVRNAGSEPQIYYGLVYDLNEPVNLFTTPFPSSIKWGWRNWAIFKSSQTSPFSCSFYQNVDPIGEQWCLFKNLNKNEESCEAWSISNPYSLSLISEKTNATFGDNGISWFPCLPPYNESKPQKALSRAAKTAGKKKHEGSFWWEDWTPDGCLGGTNLDFWLKLKMLYICLHI